MTEKDPPAPSTTEAHSSDIEKGVVVNGGDTSDEKSSNGGKKGSVRTGDKSNEALVIPKNRIVIVFIGLMLTVFLAALDQTIVCTYPQRGKEFARLICYLATALPTIVRDLQGAQNYAWVGTSYLLASAAFTPLYGRARYPS